VTHQPTLADRYGAPSPLRRRLLVGGSAVLAVVFLGWLAWTALSHGDPEVRSEIVTFTIDGEHEATARVDVRLRDDDVEATCRLRAIAEDHTIVGELSFGVDAGVLAGGTTVERTVRTERRATSVDLVGCTTADQQRPR
jgi:hypothetical protein